MQRFASRSDRGRKTMVVWLGLRPKPRVREGKARKARNRETKKTILFPTGGRPDLDAKRGSRLLPPLRVAPCSISRASPAPPVASATGSFGVLENVEELPGSETPGLPVAKATPPRRRLPAERGNPKPILFPAGGRPDLDAKRTSRPLCSPPSPCLQNSGSGPEHGRDGPEVEMRPAGPRRLPAGGVSCRMRQRHRARGGSARPKKGTRP